MSNGRSRQEKAKGQREFVCCCCQGSFRFCWSCSCGFEICQACMHENLWGVTCNNVTWICPDCGKSRSF